MGKTLTNGNWSLAKKLLSTIGGNAGRYFVFFSVFSSSLSILDLISLGLLAAVTPSILSNKPIFIPFLGEVGGDRVLLFLLFIVFLIFLKSFASLILQKSSAKRFARMQLDLGARLLYRNLRMPWVERIAINSSQLVRTADVSVSSAVLGFLYPLSAIPSHLATLIAVFIVLVIAQPLTAILAAIYLALVALFIFLFVSRRSHRAGSINREFSEATNSFIVEMIASLKELTLRDATSKAEAVVHNYRLQSSDAQAQIVFLNSLPRYIFEIALIGGFLLIGGVTYLNSGFNEAVTAIIIFAVGGFRMIPSLTGINSGLSVSTSNQSHVSKVLSDISHLDEVNEIHPHIQQTTTKIDRVCFEKVGFTYSGSEKQALADITFDFVAGQKVAIVGASGSGKSTLLDLVLGFLDPECGKITIGDKPMPQTKQYWQSQIGYVPQSVSIFDGTIEENISLSWSRKPDIERVRKVLDIVDLSNLLNPENENQTKSLGENGIKLSGGQRQRLGIARALYPNPSVIVLDEATSSLDTSTESFIMDRLNKIPGLTIIATAHRLSTIKEFDKIIFLSNGQLKTIGTFSEVVQSEPEFKNQAKLAKLL